MEVVDFAALPDLPCNLDEDIEGKCTRSVPNDKRRRVKAQSPQPRVAATRTPRLDDNLRQILLTAARAMDKELAKIQTFILDAVSPLVSLLEAEMAGKTVAIEEARGATTAALELLCDASTRISCMRHEKVCAHLKKEVQPLAQWDERFTDAAPDLFRAEFAQKSKEQVEQMKAIQAVLPLAKKPFFRMPPRKLGG